MTDILPSAVLLYGNVKVKHTHHAEMIILPIHQHVVDLGYTLFTQRGVLHRKTEHIADLENKYVETYNNNHSPYIISFMPQRLKEIKESYTLIQVLSAVCAFEDECAELLK